jgi:hypothetical protein
MGVRMKERLEKELEYEKVFSEKTIEAGETIIPHLVIFKGDTIVPIFSPEREDIIKVLRAVLTTEFDMLIVSFEGYMREVKEEKLEEYTKRYKYGDVQKDKSSIEVVVIWGIEKKTNYRCVNIYKKEGSKLSLLHKLENEDFDRVMGNLSFMGI